MMVGRTGRNFVRMCDQLKTDPQDSRPYRMQKRGNLRQEDARCALHIDSSCAHG